MFLSLLSLLSPAQADPLVIGLGARQVFREEAALDALTLSVSPSWGALSLELSGAWGLSPAEPSTLERALVSVATNIGAGELDLDVAVDRATLGAALVLSPPLSVGMRGGPRAILGVEGRLLSVASLNNQGEGAELSDPEGWSLGDPEARLGYGPVLGLGFGLCPTPRAGLSLDARDRMLVLGDGDLLTLDAPSGSLRHDLSLQLQATMALGGVR